MVTPITATTTTNKFYTGKVAVQFQLTTSLTGNCSTNYTAAAANQFIAATSTAIISAKKISVVVPTLTAAGGAGTTPDLAGLCLQQQQHDHLEAAGQGRVHQRRRAGRCRRLTANVQVPTYGGTTINVVGTGFAAGVNSATLGGKQLTDINVVDDTLFTATTPANPAGNAALDGRARSGGTDTTLSGDEPPTSTSTRSRSARRPGSAAPGSAERPGLRLQQQERSPTSTGRKHLSDEAKTHVYLVNTAVGATLGYDPANNTGKKTKAAGERVHQHPGHQRHRAGLHARPEPEDGRCSGHQPNLVAGPNTRTARTRSAMVADGGIGGYAAQQALGSARPSRWLRSDPPEHRTT